MDFSKFFSGLAPKFTSTMGGNTGVETCQISSSRELTSLALNRLGEREAAAIIARIVGNKDLPADVTAEIVERTS